MSGAITKPSTRFQSCVDLNGYKTGQQRGEIEDAF